MLSSLYPQLHRMAARTLAGWGRDGELQVTELVNEAYASLADLGPTSWQSRLHFLSFVSRVMRNILIDLYRERQSDKRGGGFIRIALEPDLVAGNVRDVDVLALHQALARLEEEDSEAGRIIELRFFAGLTLDECAETLGLGRATVARRWRFARAWLHDQLGG